MAKKIFLLIILTSSFAYSQEKYLETVKITDSIFVFKPKIDWINSNCTAIIGKDGIFIVDTFMQTNYADEAIKSLKKITPLPVKFIFNTHGHADHVIGNSVFKAAYPDCKIIMNDSTYAKYPRNFKYAGDAIKIFGSEIPQLERELAASKTDGGLTLTEPLKEFWELQLKNDRDYVKFFKPIKPANADIVFHEKMTIYFGGHQITLMPAEGEGHDVGDAMAWLPNKGILITGDVVVGPTPYAIRGRVDEMIRSLNQIIKMNPKVVIPGHGEVFQGIDYVKNEKELFEMVKQKCIEEIDNGVSYKDAMADMTIPIDLEKKFTEDDDVRKWAMKSFFTNWVVRGTYSLKGALPENK